MSGEVNPELDPNLESLAAIKRSEEKEKGTAGEKIARSLNNSRIGMDGGGATSVFG